MSFEIETATDHEDIAGRSGPEVRSDVQVRIEPRELGGIVIELESRVKLYYGDSILRQTEQLLEALGVKHAQVSVHGNFGGTRPICLMPIVESALGIEKAFEIASATPDIAALTIGLEDYTADLGVAKTSTGAESLYARQRIVNAARAAGVQAIDSVFGDVGDMDGLRTWAVDSRAMGFEGMGCVHPVQIPVIHQAFAPTEMEIEKARRIVAAYEEAQMKGLGVVSLGSKMIDAPVVNRALKLIAQAQAMGLMK